MVSCLRQSYSPDVVLVYILICMLLLFVFTSADKKERRERERDKLLTQVSRDKRLEIRFERMRERESRQRRPCCLSPAHTHTQTHVAHSSEQNAPLLSLRRLCTGRILHIKAFRFVCFTSLRVASLRLQFRHKGQQRCRRRERKGAGWRSICAHTTKSSNQLAVDVLLHFALPQKAPGSETHHQRKCLSFPLLLLSLLFVLLVVRELQIINTARPEKKKDIVYVCVHDNER